MRAVIVIAAVAIMLASATPDYATMFDSFKREHGKQYLSATEESTRFNVFVENMKTAADLQAKNPLATFGVNRFSDMTAAEFQTYHNGRAFYASRRTEGAETLQFTAEQVKAAAGQTIDWRAKGAVTYVKNQGQCGSCWAFSSTGSIEGQWFLAGNALTAVSEQELVSCDTTDAGCNGGLMDNAWSWLLSNRGGKISTETSYPYVSGTGTVPACDASQGTTGATITGQKNIGKTEDEMAAFVFASGPLSVAVDATSWQSYTGGIMTNCVSSQLDHGVLVVGFDDNNQPPYWIVKNSWATSWGEQGYIRLEKGTNQCLIANDPCTSLVSGGPSPTSGPTPPSPPTPAPVANGTMTQMQCTSADCTTGCQNVTFPLGQCLQLSGGASAIASCDSTSITLIEYILSATCTGPSVPDTMPTGQCLQDTSGSYFENFCDKASGRFVAQSAAKLRHLKKKQ